MISESELRPNEVAVAAPPPEGAGLVYIGRISTPWTSRSDCPRQGSHDGPLCSIEVFEPWVEGLRHVDTYPRLEVIYWLDKARRDLVLQSPKSDGDVRGTFSIRSPVRPNPIGTSIIKLVRVEGPVLIVQGMDCLDGTPLLDIKPDRSVFSPLAAAQAETGAAERQPGPCDPQSTATMTSDALTTA